MSVFCGNLMRNEHRAPHTRAQCRIRHLQSRLRTVVLLLVHARPHSLTHPHYAQRRRLISMKLHRNVVYPGWQCWHTGKQGWADSMHHRLLDVPLFNIRGPGAFLMASDATETGGGGAQFPTFQDFVLGIVSRWMACCFGGTLGKPALRLPRQLIRRFYCASWLDGRCWHFRLPTRFRSALPCTARFEIRDRQQVGPVIDLSTEYIV